MKIKKKPKMTSITIRVNENILHIIDEYKRVYNKNTRTDAIISLINKYGGEWLKKTKGE